MRGWPCPWAHHALVHAAHGEMKGELKEEKGRGVNDEIYIVSSHTIVRMATRGKHNTNRRACSEYGGRMHVFASQYVQ